MFVYKERQRERERESREFRICLYTHVRVCVRECVRESARASWQGILMCVCVQFQRVHTS
jgi:hypothetical protein